MVHFVHKRRDVQVVLEPRRRGGLHSKRREQEPTVACYGIALDAAALVSLNELNLSHSVGLVVLQITRRKGSPSLPLFTLVLPAC